MPALLVGGMFATQAMSSQGGVSMPSVEAESGKKVTAKPVEQISEKEKINKRLAASMLTRDWGKLTLGTKGLLGLGGQ
jgi:hypothetical protein